MQPTGKLPRITARIVFVHCTEMCYTIHECSRVTVELAWVPRIAVADFYTGSCSAATPISSCNRRRPLE